MARLLAVALVLGSLGLFLVIQTQGVDRAFGGALARFTKGDAAQATSYEAPARRRAQDSWEREERRAPTGLPQRVRERVNGAMEKGAARNR